MIFVFTAIGSVVINNETCLIMKSNADFMPEKFAMSKSQVNRLNIVKYFKDSIAVRVDFNGEGVDAYDLTNI